MTKYTKYLPKQWFAGGAQSRGLRKPGCGHCYLRFFVKFGHASNYVHFWRLVADMSVYLRHKGDGVLPVKLSAQLMRILNLQLLLCLRSLSNDIEGDERGD